MYKILLVDDEILVRDAIRENIDWKSLDCELVGDCENGRQAVEFVQSHKVDVVLTDICMPYMDGMELSEFLHDNYPDILIVIFSGFGEFEYAKKAIRYNVSEYMLKPVTAMELTKVLRNMKEKLDSRKKEQKKMESLSQTSKDYHKNVDVIRSKALETLVNCTRDVQVSLLELKKLGISFDCSSYRVAVFDMDTYSEMYQVDMHKQQESALMSFVLFNISNEIVTRENAGVAYQEGSNRVCIIFTGCRSREFGDKIHSICQEIQQKVKEVIGIETSIGIGSWVRSPQELVYSYKLAEKAIGYRYLLGGSLLFDMDTYSEMYQVDMHKQQESALMSFVLFNIGNEIVTRENAGVAYQEGSNRVCIIFTGCRSREFGDKIHSICQEIQQKVKEVIGIETSIGIGSWVRSPQELVYSYKLAEKAIGYRYLLGGSLLLDMEEKKTDNSINLIKSLETLTEEIKVGNRQKVTEILEQIEHEIKGALVEKSYACIYLQQVIRAIGNTCQSLSDDPEKIIAQREKLLKEVSQAKTFDKAVTLVKEYAEGVFESLQDLNSSSGQRQGMMAMDYIRKNYMDPDLSLNSICSYLNISTSYFSTIFKEMTGETFIESLTRIRMEKAKELLENTTLKNYEIAEKVGFSDPHYFGISFKKMTGKTPTEYAREKRR